MSEQFKWFAGMGGQKMEAMEVYLPTSELRFVRRWYGDKIQLILQQKWSAQYVQDSDEWRDVPAIDEP